MGKTHDQHLEAARQGTILNSHRVIGIATNTSMVLNCTLVKKISASIGPALVFNI